MGKRQDITSDNIFDLPNEIPAEDFPPDGTENTNDFADTDDDSDDSDGDDVDEDAVAAKAQDVPAPQPTAAPSPAPARRKYVRSRGAAPRPARKPRNTTVTTRTTTTTEDPDAAESTTSAQRPSILRLLAGGTGTNQIAVKRIRTKGSNVAPTDTGYCGRFANTIGLPETISARYGGGVYELTGDENGKTLTEELELPGPSQPLAESSEGAGFLDFRDDFRGWRRDSDIDGIGAGVESLDGAHPDQAWWVWDTRRGEWRWTKPSCPTPNCPPPNQGLPPAQVMQNTNSDWWNRGNPGATQADEQLAHEREARRKAEEDARLFQLQTRHEKEMADVKNALNSLHAKFAEPRQDPMQDWIKIMQSQNERAEAERKEKAQEDQRRWEREQERRRDEENKRQSELRHELEKREAERKDERERREAERKEMLDRDERKLEEQRAREERLFNLMMSSKKDGMSQVKEFAGIFSAVKDLVGGGGSESSSESVELLKVGGQIVSDNLIPALSDAIMAWKFGKQTVQPQDADINDGALQQAQITNHGPVTRAPQALPGAPPAGDSELNVQDFAKALEFILTSYQNNNSPKMTSIALAGWAQGVKVDYNKIKAKVAETSADSLVSMLSNYEMILPANHPAKQQLAQARATIGSADGRVWWSSLSNILGGRTPKTDPPAAPPAAP